MSIHDFGFPLNYSDELCMSKADLREDNDRLIAEFLARGGVIKQIAAGVSGIAPADMAMADVMRLPAWQRQEWFKKRQILSNDVVAIDLVDEHVARVETLENEAEAVAEVAPAVSE